MVLMSFSENLFLKIQKKNHFNHYNQYLYSYVIFIRFKVTHLQIQKRKEKKSYLLLLLQYQTKYLKISNNNTSFQKFCEMFIYKQKRYTNY